MSAHAGKEAIASITEAGCVYALPRESEKGDEQHHAPVAHVPGARGVAVVDEGILIVSDLGSMALVPWAEVKRGRTHYAEDSLGMLANWEPRKKASITSLWGGECHASLVQALLGGEGDGSGLLALEGRSDGTVAGCLFRKGQVCKQPRTLFSLHQPVLNISLFHHGLALFIGKAGRVVNVTPTKRFTPSFKDTSFGQPIDRALPADANESILLLARGNLVRVNAPSLANKGGAVETELLHSSACDMDARDGSAFLLNAFTREWERLPSVGSPGHGISCSADESISSAAAEMERINRLLSMAERRERAIDEKLSHSSEALLAAKEMRSSSDRRPHPLASLSSQIGGSGSIAHVGINNRGTATLKSWSIVYVAANPIGPSASLSVRVPRLPPGEEWQACPGALDVACGSARGRVLFAREDFLTPAEQAREAPSSSGKSMSSADLWTLKERVVRVRESIGEAMSGRNKLAALEARDGLLAVHSALRRRGERQ